MVEVVKPCKYVLKEEVCPYGSRCRFGHGSPQNESQDLIAEVADMKMDKTPTTETSPNKPPPHKERQNLRQKNCYFYLHSHCRYGNKCKFSHPRRSGFQKNKATEKNKATDVNTAGMASPLPVPTEVAPDQVNTPLAKTTMHQNDSETKGTGNIHKRDPESATGKMPAAGRKTRVTHQSHTSSDQAESKDTQSTTGGSEIDRTTTRPKAEYRPTENRSHRNAYEKTSGRTKKTEDYQSQSGAPPPLTLESFLTRQPVKRPQRASSRQKEPSKGSVREVELEQLRVRFPGDKCELLEKGKDCISYCIHFTPTDQDWHGPETILLKVKFPESYPNQYCSVEMLADQDILPETVEVFNMAAESYWSADMLGTLMFRPFLHWMDRNIVELLDIQPKNRGALEGKVESKQRTSDDSDDSGREEEEEEAEGNASCALVKSKKGTEIRLIGLNTSQSLGTAYWPVISVVLACARCKHHKEVELKEERGYSIVCERCNSSYTAIYHIALIHVNTFTLGYLELNNCSPVDVVFQSSSLTMTCLNCSCEVTSSGFFIDQPKDEYCRRCHNKMSISATGVRFLQHQQVDTPTSLSAGNVIVLSASGRKAQADLFKDGCPLPDYGVCQHYKKSHRWLRFPCCGRAFPCDVCHDATQDHPMDRATKMICGYCSREQTYSAKGECVRCGADMVSSKTTSHWEGGQGCRNKVKMNRLDKHKYKNSDVKTACKKSERVGKKGT